MKKKCEYYTNARIYLSRPFSLAFTDFLTSTWHVFLFYQIDRVHCLHFDSTRQTDADLSFIIRWTFSFQRFDAQHLTLENPSRDSYLFWAAAAALTLFCPIHTQRERETETRSVEEDWPLVVVIDPKRRTTTKTEEDRTSERKKK
jgi:hypothetical protein